MDTLLIVITGVSVVAAVVSTTIAWRVVQADRRRAASRVAALAAAAGVSAVRTAAVESEPAARADSVVDVPTGLHEFMPVAPEATGATPLTAGRTLASAADAATSPAGALFGRPAVDSGSSGRQHGLMAAAAAFAVVVVAGAGVLFVSGRTPGATSAPTRTPLELVTLGHARTDGQLAVQGVVRNPAQGAPVDRIEAEVRVFDAAGLVIATRSTRIEPGSLPPGHDAPFAVALGEVPAAARYRVSFSADGSMLPHVDRRTNLPAAVTAEAR